jgi:hypothetical protein
MNSRDPKNRAAMEEATRKRTRNPPSISRLSQVDSGFAEKQPNTVENLSRHQLIYSVAGLILGLACVIGGVILFLHGVTGSMSWTAEFLGANSKISDAAPGAVLFIVGLFTVFLTRYGFKTIE